MDFDSNIEYATMCDGAHTHFGPCTLHRDKSAAHAYVHAYTA